MNKTVKYFLSFFCAILSIAILYSPAAHAEEAVIIEAGSAEGKTGDTITIPVSIHNSSQVAALDITVVYDPEELRYISSERGEATKKGTLCDINHLSDQASIRFVFSSLKEIPNDGDIMELTFQILNNEPEIHTVDLDVREVLDINIQKLSWQVKGGREIAPAEPDETDDIGTKTNNTQAGESTDSSDALSQENRSENLADGSDRRFFARTKNGIEDVTDTAASRTGENLLDEDSALAGTAEKENETSDTGTGVIAAACAVIILLIIAVGVVIYKVRKKK